MMPLITKDSLNPSETINRYWDKTQRCWAIKLLPGQVYVTSNNNEILTTTLGSCVSACIRDNKLGIGGINHFMLPESKKGGSDLWLDMAARYGSFAMEILINEILKKGGYRDNLEVKLTGGGRIVANMSDVGKHNIAFAKSYVARENLTLLAEDLGGVHPRKIIYNPITGMLKIKKLRSLHNDTILLREEQYQHTLAKMPDAGNVELF